MAYIDLNSGELRTGEQTRSMIEAAAQEMQRIDYAKSKEVARYLRNRAPGLSLAIADLHTRLQALFPLYTADAVRLACLIFYLLGALRKRPGPAPLNERTAHLLGAFALLKDLLGDKTDELLEAVEALSGKTPPGLKRHRGFQRRFASPSVCPQGCDTELPRAVSRLLQFTHAPLGTPQKHLSS